MGLESPWRIRGPCQDARAVVRLNSEGAISRGLGAVYQFRSQGSFPSAFHIHTRIHTCAHMHVYVYIHVCVHVLYRFAKYTYVPTACTCKGVQRDTCLLRGRVGSCKVSMRVPETAGSNSGARQVIDGRYLGMWSLMYQTGEGPQWRPSKAVPSHFW